jgi:hypothetical protein
MDPTRCNGLPLSPLLLRQHLPVLDLRRSGEASLGGPFRDEITER